MAALVTVQGSTAMAPSGFLVRDVIQHMIPTLVGLVLFVPFAAHNADAVPLLLGAVVLAYAAGPLLASLARPVTRLLLAVSGRSRRHGRNRVWWNGNFDFVRLWYRLTQTQRENLYATQAYAEMYAMLAVYLLAYAITNIVLTVNGVVLPTLEGDIGLDYAEAVGQALWSPATPLFGDWRAPSIAMAVIGLSTALFAIANHLREMEILFGDEGQYVSLARIHHIETGDIATGLWGRITRAGEPLRNASITVMDIRDQKLGWAETDRQGRFQIRNVFAESFPPGQETGARTFRLEISTDDEDKVFDLALTRRQIPELSINLT